MHPPGDVQVEDGAPVEIRAIEDIARTPNEHLAFGGGVHFCLGAHLARMESQVAIGTRVRRAPELELASDEIEWGRSLFRVLARLPVRIAKVR